MRRLWGRKVSDLGFGDFLQKAEWMIHKLGKILVRAGRWEPSTQECCRCRYRQTMPLDAGLFRCELCGNIEDRDVNAAINILEAGLRLWLGDTYKTSKGAGVAGSEIFAFVTAESHGL